MKHIETNNKFNYWRDCHVIYFLFNCRRDYRLASRINIRKKYSRRHYWKYYRRDHWRMAWRIDYGTFWSRHCRNSYYSSINWLHYISVYLKSHFTIYAPGVIKSMIVNRQDVTEPCFCYVLSILR